MVVDDEADQHAIMAADMSKTEGTIGVATTTTDPPQVGGVKVESEVSKTKPLTVGTMVGRDTRKVNGWKKKADLHKGKRAMSVERDRTT